jgi:hypothetical protein
MILQRVSLIFMPGEGGIFFEAARKNKFATIENVKIA